MIVTINVVMTDVTQEDPTVVITTAEDLDLEVGIEKVIGMKEVIEGTVEETVMVTVGEILGQNVEVSRKEQPDVITVNKKVI